MKQLAIAALFVVTIFSCKKDKTGSATSDLFKNTDWTGEYEYNGAKYVYGMAFSNGDSMVFYHAYGPLAGIYHVNLSARTISINVANGKLVGEFGFSDDGKFTTFDMNSASTFQLLNGELNGSSLDLVQTIWEGNTYNNSWPFSLRFLSESEVALSFPTGNIGVDFKIQAHTIQFHVDAYYFGIIKDTVIKGIVYNQYLTPSMQNWSVQPPFGASISSNQRRVSASVHLCSN